jgi:predicted transcriptional regulator
MLKLNDGGDCVVDFLIKIFKALANEHRVNLLHLLLKKGEREISGLAQDIGIPYKTASRNLKILEQTNLVISRRWQGLVYYPGSRKPRPLAVDECAGSWPGCRPAWAFVRCHGLCPWGSTP